MAEGLAVILLLVPRVVLVAVVVVVVVVLEQSQAELHQQDRATMAVLVILQA